MKEHVVTPAPTPFHTTTTNTNGQMDKVTPTQPPPSYPPNLVTGVTLKQNAQLVSIEVMVTNAGEREKTVSTEVMGY